MRYGFCVEELNLRNFKRDNVRESFLWVSNKTVRRKCWCGLLVFQFPRNSVSEILPNFRMFVWKVRAVEAVLNKTEEQPSFLLETKERRALCLYGFVLQLRTYQKMV